VLDQKQEFRNDNLAKHTFRPANSSLALAQGAYSATGNLRVTGSFLLSFVLCAGNFGERGQDFYVLFLRPHVLPIAVKIHDDYSVRPFWAGVWAALRDGSSKPQHASAVLGMQTDRASWCLGQDLH
jgi:hypothetical protein